MPSPSPQNERSHVGGSEWVWNHSNRWTLVTKQWGWEGLARGWVGNFLLKEDPLGGQAPPPSGHQGEETLCKLQGPSASGMGMPACALGGSPVEAAPEAATTKSVS